MLLLILTTGKVLFYSFVTVIALYIIAKVVDKIKTVRYEKDIAFLESCVKNFVITPRNQKMIEELFDKIFKNNQDAGRTKEIWDVFAQKYYKSAYSKKVVEKQLN